MSEITFLQNPEVTNDQLNFLFSNAWSNHSYTDFSPNLHHCLLYICVFLMKNLLDMLL